LKCGIFFDADDDFRLGSEIFCLSGFADSDVVLFGETVGIRQCDMNQSNTPARENNGDRHKSRCCTSDKLHQSVLTSDLESCRKIGYHRYRTSGLESKFALKARNARFGLSLFFFEKRCLPASQFNL
jgi:hypothetical protein